MEHLGLGEPWMILAEFLEIHLVLYLTFILVKIIEMTQMTPEKDGHGPKTLQLINHTHAISTKMLLF